MINLTDMTGLASAASATVASVRLLPGIARMTKPAQAAVLSGVFVLMLIPFAGMPLAAYVRGMTGDLSITTLVLLWCAILKPWFGSASETDRYALLILIGVASLVLYPMALGLGGVDPYRAGYGNPLFMAVLLLTALVLWRRDHALTVWCISLAVLAWATGWYESNNLWDYLLDPFVAIYALASIITAGLRRLVRRGFE